MLSKENRQKTVAVLFTGGLDSTYLIYKNLKEGNTVIPFYITIKNNEQKILMEKRSTAAIFDVLDKEYHSRIYQPVEIMAIDLWHCKGSAALPQMPVWIFGLWFIQNYPIKLDEIQIGYVMNDDAISYLDDMVTVYNSYHSLTNPSLINSSNRGEMIPLTFPLVKHHKIDMMDDMPEPLAALVMSCEYMVVIGDDHYSCGDCDPCKKYAKMHHSYHRKFKQIYSYKKLSEINSSIHEVDRRANELRARMGFSHLWSDPFSLKVASEDCLMVSG
jgi:7-cyano-7-deazaguanine synthase in queuosine biosynthesis